MYFNVGDISELIKFDEKIFELVNKLYFVSENEKKNLMEYINMFLIKEKRIISDLPIDDREFNEYILSNLNDFILNNIYDSDNFDFIFSRLSNLFYDNILKIKPDSKYEHAFDGSNFYVKDNYFEHNYYLNSRIYYKNLIIRYLKSLDDLKQLDIYDSSSLLNIQNYNFFIERDIFNEYINSGCDISQINFYTDEEMCSGFGYDNEDFEDLKNEVITTKLYDFISLMINNSFDSIYYLDAELNFKFFLGQLSYDCILDFKNKVDYFLDEFLSKFEGNKEKIGENINIVNGFLDDELSRKSNYNFCKLSDDNYKQFNKFISLEKELLSLIENFDFEKTNIQDLKKLDCMLEIENDFVLELNNNENISLFDFNQFFVFELPKILNDDSGRLFKLLNDRIFQLFPVFNSFIKNPGQSKESFDVINNNFIISSIRLYYDLLMNISDENIKDIFYDVYKEQFFSNPVLTKLLLFMDGNHLMIEPYSFDISYQLSHINQIEYNYDLNVQLFSKAGTLIDELSLFESDIQDVDNAYLQFKLIQFNYISQYLNSEKLEDLADIIIDNYIDSSIFDILYTIIQLNLNDAKYDLNISVSSNNSNINILSL